jgi:hypothetical protein
MSRTVYLESVGSKGEDSQRYRIDRLPCIIGRGRNCDLDLPREQVSRRHARIDGGQDSLIIEDLGSTNGTFVNLDRITGPVPVIPGDRIHLGSDEYVLVEVEGAGRTRSPERPSEAAAAGHTVIGFTADPTGFPVQAPQFYELLNDELVAIHSQPIIDANGRTRATALKAASRHPDLDVQHDELQHLAAQLGEEARLNRVIREHALQAADRSGLDEHPLILTAHPGELDDMDLLIDELRSSRARHTHLELALELKVQEIDHNHLDRMLTELVRLDIQPVLALPDPRPGEQLELAIEHGAWVTIGSHHDTGEIEVLCDALPSRLNQVIVDCVDDRHRLEQLKGLPDIWLRGHGAVETTPRH